MTSWTTSLMSFCAFLEVMFMIEIISCVTKEDKKLFVDFAYQVYEDDMMFYDINTMIMKKYLYLKTSHAKEIVKEVLLVKKEDQVVCECMLLKGDNQDVLQVGFFEALPGHIDAVYDLVHYATKHCIDNKISKISFGINGHVSVGVGFLHNQKEEDPPLFNSLYTKDYYLDYFRELGFEESLLHTYAGEVDTIYSYFEDNMNLQNSYKMRYLNRFRFKRDMKIFNELTNQTLKDTEMYYPVKENHMFDLMKVLKFWLRPHHLIFAMKNGKEVGYIFVHPDFNQALTPGRRNSLKDIILDKRNNNSLIDRVKINAICLKENDTNLLFDLIHTSIKEVIKRGYKVIETGFIFDSNRQSKALAKKTRYKQKDTYSVFYKEVKHV